MKKSPLKPKISIIMPFKNTAEFLEECLDSILGQSEESWELLAVNDGSTDESVSIVSNYAKKDSRIRVMENKGEGIIEALQTGYSNSSGAFITRMDSDDIMASTKLECLIGLLNQQGLGFVATGLVHYFSSSGVLGEGYYKYQQWLNGLTQKGENFQEIYKECAIPSPCWMLHRPDFEAIGGFGSNVYPEDYELAFRMYSKGLKVIPTDQVIHHWRDYSTRTSRTHIHYADNGFIQLKTQSFLQIDYDPSGQLILWGAGKKAKAMAKILQSKGCSFHWVCNNPKKIGKEIYGKILTHYATLPFVKSQQHLVSVASPSAQQYFKKLFTHHKAESYFFC